MVKNIEYINRIPFLIYYLIALLLLFSAITKILKPIPTIETLKAAFKFSDEINLAMATVLPIIEVALAPMILFNYKVKLTLAIVTVLFFFFFLFAVYGTAIGINEDCGCFGSVLRSESGITMILRNLTLTALTLWLVFVHKKFATAGRKKNKSTNNLNGE
ncbi:MAG: Methylamine utilization protein [Ignavibacteria bacterium]|nr:MAG: Methylamine utilization protein [Ignavibacteria bacterium]KAF0156543.1 MAG: Methylamine utilization protein [Ignavibacteria bacterium]